MFLSPFSAVSFLDPEVLWKDTPEEVVVRFPCKQDPVELAGLGLQWDAQHKLALFGVDEVPAHLTSNVMSVFKSDTQDRLVVDRRCRNAHEQHIEGFAKLLPTGADLTSIHVPSLNKHQLRVYSHDLQDFYPSFEATVSRAASNCIGQPLPSSLFEGSFALKARPELRNKSVYVGLKSLPMGDKNAVDWAQ